VLLIIIIESSRENMDVGKPLSHCIYLQVVDRSKDSEVLYSMRVATQEMLDAIPYITEAQVLEQAGRRAFEQGDLALTVDRGVVSVSTLQLIERILRRLDFRVPPPAKVSSNDARDAVGPALHDLLGALSPPQLVELHKAAQFLQMGSLRLSVASMFAARVYVQGTYEHFEQLKLKLGITAPFSYDYMQKRKAENAELSMII
jgi:hypothetical protein